MVLQRWIITKSKVQNEFANVSSFTWTSGIFTGVTVTEKKWVSEKFCWQKQTAQVLQGSRGGGWGHTPVVCQCSGWEWMMCVLPFWQFVVCCWGSPVSMCTVNCLGPGCSVCRLVWWGMTLLNAELQSTNSTLMYVLCWSRCVRTVWSVVLTASSVDLFVQ